MTIRLRFTDLSFSDGRFDLGGRIVATSDIISISVQRRVSAASLACILIGGLLLVVCIKYGTWAAILIGVPMAALLFAGAIREWQRPYVLVLHVLQLGMVEVASIPEFALPAIEEFAASL